MSMWTIKFIIHITFVYMHTLLGIIQIITLKQQSCLLRGYNRTPISKMKLNGSYQVRPSNCLQMCIRAVQVFWIFTMMTWHHYYLYGFICTYIEAVHCYYEGKRREFTNKKPERQEQVKRNKQATKSYLSINKYATSLQ